jgi:hypothetical protein
MGSMVIKRDGFEYNVIYSFNVDRHVIEVFFPGNIGFRLSKDNEEFPASVSIHLEEILEWSDVMIESFKNFLFSNEWPEKATMGSNGAIQHA